MSLPLRVIGILAAIWLVATGVIFALRAAKPTPENIATYVSAHPLEQTANREALVEKVAAKLNTLDFEERQRLQRSGAIRTFYEQMTDEERARFLNLTMPEGFRQVMLALNKMTPEKRKEIVERALQNIKERGEIGDGDGPRVDDEMMKKIVGQGMAAFYEDASADVKLDFAPVIEQIQQSLQWR